jgi:hypothetical protein
MEWPLLLVSERGEEVFIFRSPLKEVSIEINILKTCPEVLRIKQPLTHRSLECPIAPGSSYTDTWRATQYGSSWYHSHFFVQAWDGIFGGIQINGPATANYDVDLGTLTLSDWSHETAEYVLSERHVLRSAY